MLPLNISEMFFVNNSIHHYDTRNSNLFHMFKVNTTFAKKSVRFNLPVVWNSLSNDIHCQKIFKDVQKISQKVLS